MWEQLVSETVTEHVLPYLATAVAGVAVWAVAGVARWFGIKRKILKREDVERQLMAVIREVEADDLAGQKAGELASKGAAKVRAAANRWVAEQTPKQVRLALKLMGVTSARVEVAAYQAVQRLVASALSRTS